MLTLIKTQQVGRQELRQPLSGEFFLLLGSSPSPALLLRQNLFSTTRFYPFLLVLGRENQKSALGFLFCPQAIRIEKNGKQRSR